MPRLRLVDDRDRNRDVIPFPTDHLRRVSRHGDDAAGRVHEVRPTRAKADSIRQVEQAMTDVQKNLDELADLLAPLPFDHFARQRREDRDDDRPWAA